PGPRRRTAAARCARSRGRPSPRARSPGPFRRPGCPRTRCRHTAGVRATAVSWPPHVGATVAICRRPDKLSDGQRRQLPDAGALRSERSLGAGERLVDRVESCDPVGPVPGSAGDLEAPGPQVGGAVDAHGVAALARAATDEGAGAERDQGDRVVVHREAADRLDRAGPGGDADEADRVLAAPEGRAAVGWTAVADLPLLLELGVARQPVKPPDAPPGPVVAAEDVGEGVARPGADPEAGEPGDVLLAVAGAASARDGALDAGVVDVGAEEALDVTAGDGGVGAGRAQPEHLPVDGGEGGHALEDRGRVAAGEAFRRRGRVGDGCRGLAGTGNPARSRGCLELAPAVVGAAGLEDAVGLAGLEVLDDVMSRGLIERVGGSVGGEGP